MISYLGDFIYAVSRTLIIWPEMTMRYLIQATIIWPIKLKMVTMVKSLKFWNLLLKLESSIVHHHNALGK